MGQLEGDKLETDFISGDLGVLILQQEWTGLATKETVQKESQGDEVSVGRETVEGSSEPAEF